MYPKNRHLVLFLFFLSNCFIQVSASDERSFEKLESSSDIEQVRISEELSLDIYTPPNSAHADSEKAADASYPVLYVMDSQHYFYNALGYQKSLRFGVNISPEYIVVGVNTENLSKGRRDLLHDNAEQTIKLIRDSIVPYIDEHYPSNKRRVYFGWQYAAMFGLKLFNSDPKLFEGFLLASGQYYSKAELNKLAKHLSGSTTINNHFYLSLGEMEKHTLDGHKAMANIFRQYESRGIKWKFSYFDRFSTKYDHHTTPLESLTHGLEWYFSDFPDLTFHSTEDIKKFGGVPAVKAYYQKRAKRYQVSSEVGEQAKFSMFRHAAQANDFKLFSEFENELGKFEVDGWYHFFGLFFFKNNQYQRAEKVYKKGIKARPQEYRLWEALAIMYEEQQKLPEAINGYQKAILHLEKANPKYSAFREKIKSLSAALNQG